MAYREYETYLEAEVKGKTVSFLLDSGCCTNIMPARLANPDEIERKPSKLLAANKSPIEVIGTVTLELTLGKQTLPIKFDVTNVVDEPILGIGFLFDYECDWNFADRKIKIAGEEIPLLERRARMSVRRIYVSQSVEVPPRSETNVPVQLRRLSRRALTADWLVEPKQLDEGIFVARTLLSDESQYPALRLINVGRKAYQVIEGQRVGDAEIVRETDICPVTGPGCSQGPTIPVNHGQPPSRVTECTVEIGNGLEHVQPVIDSLPDSLTGQQRQVAVDLIKRNADVFSKSKFGLGRTKLVQHRIDTGTSKPFKEPLRRHPKAYLDVIDEQVELMLKHDIIEKSGGAWASNVVLVLKEGEKDKDGNKTRSVRFCNGYRRLNSLTYKDSFPLPHNDKSLDLRAGNKIFSTLDLQASFWQSEIHPEDRDKTAFITRKGQFRYKVLSFGLANAPSQFQRLMSLDLAGVLWRTCLVYIDDIVLMARSVEEMAERLEGVLGRLRDANLKLKPAKCRVFQTEILFLGHRIDGNGISPDLRRHGQCRNGPFLEMSLRYELLWPWRPIIANFSRISLIPPHLFMNLHEKRSPSCGMTVGSELSSN